MALQWSSRGNLKGPKGDTGDSGAAGVGIADADVNGSGDLIVTLTDTTQVNAGHVKGGDGARLDIGNSVATVAELPDTPTLNSAFYVQADGHLYVYEGDEGADNGKPGYTDVGAIKGETGATGPNGAAGRGIVNAAVDGSGHLILTFTDTGATDLGVVKGADGSDGAPGSDGADGSDGAQGPRGTQIESFVGSVPALTGHIVGDLAVNETTGELLRVIDA